MFLCILEMMRKVLPGWEGMIFFKDLHCYYRFGGFLAGRQEAEKGLCDTVWIFLLSFSGDICVCRALSRKFCYFLKILNHKWQKNTLTDNPLTLSSGQPFWWGEAFFPLSCPHGHRAREERLNASRTGKHIAPHCQAQGCKGLWQRRMRGLPRSQVGREEGEGRPPPTERIWGKGFTPSLFWRWCCSVLLFNWSKR